MSNLKLIKTETFGDLSCNFYRNMNDDILLTREQIEDHCLAEAGRRTAYGWLAQSGQLQEPWRVY